MLSVVGREGEWVSGCLWESEKKGSGKYPKSKLILYHNNPVRKVGEQFEYYQNKCLSYSICSKYGAKAASSWQSVF